MDFQEIKFYVNGHRIGPSNIIGARPDLSFFEQVAPHVSGECELAFKVGGKLVSNKVFVKGTEYRVETDFSEFDIESYVQNEKERVRKEQELANFSDTLTDVYFIPAKTLLAWTNRFPSFDPHMLVKDPKGSKYFVSHPWIGDDHPDPNGKHIALLQEHSRRQNDECFYWIDYSCLPQAPRNPKEERFFQQTLPKIATIQSKGSTIAIVDSDYSKRMWCYMEHFAGLLFSMGQVGQASSSIEYIGDESCYYPMLEKIQTLEEPPWQDLHVTNPTDIPGIQYNYKFLSNIAKFHLYDRFSELRRTLPGHEIYSGLHYFQCAFGLSHTNSLRNLRKLFVEFGGDIQYFYKEQSLLWLAERFSWSVFPDDYPIAQFNFSPYLVYSKEMCAWMVLLLSIIRMANEKNKRIVNFREAYARIILMSLYE